MIPDQLKPLFRKRSNERTEPDAGFDRYRVFVAIDTNDTIEAGRIDDGPG